MIDNFIKNAIRRVVGLSMPFVVFSKPNTDKVYFFADLGCESANSACMKFKVNTWCGGAADEYIINCNVTASEIVSCTKKFAPSLVKPWNVSTAHNEYVEKVDQLIEHLQDFGGKTVFSRTICGDCHDIDWIVVADNYFEAHPEAFRYFYYTPRHGYWLGASPELLVRVEGDNFQTMALAGTRKRMSDGGLWDGKNLAEQAIVRNYIVDRLYNLGLEPRVGETETIATGNLEHLRTVIGGECKDCTFDEILRALNPTPALAGYPLASAMENIVAMEPHPRRCYGAYVALTDGNTSEAFVNLRCVNFDSERWCMYVGGGIMPDSDSENEWLETDAKATLLLNFILNAGGEVDAK